MKAHYKSLNGRLMIEAERPNIKELFRDLAEIQEILDADQACGVCGGTNLRFRVRHATKGPKTYEYFEMVCANDACRAVLEFGQKQDMVGLFPRRKDENVWLPNRGWQRYQKPGTEAPRARSGAPPEEPPGNARPAAPAATRRAPSPTAAQAEAKDYRGRGF